MANTRPNKRSNKSLRLRGQQWQGVLYHKKSNWHRESNRATRATVRILLRSMVKTHQSGQVASLLSISKGRRRTDTWLAWEAIHQTTAYIPKESYHHPRQIQDWGMRGKDNWQTQDTRDLMASYHISRIGTWVVLSSMVSYIERSLQSMEKIGILWAKKCWEQCHVLIVVTK